MNDKEFLEWIKARMMWLEDISENVDYMRKLQAIINTIPEDQQTPNV